jgi:long-chain acyl-CoA synthetase
MITEKGTLMNEQKRYEQYYKEIITQDNVTYAGSMLKRAFHKWPDRIAYICGDDSISYKNLYMSASHISQQLRNNDVAPGDKVVLLYENSIDFFIAYFGIWQAGCIVVPLNVFLQENEVEKLIDNTDPRALIVSSKLKEKLGKHKDSKNYIRLSHDDIKQARSENKLPENYDITTRDADDMAALLYTSGTTGFPKGVMLSSTNIIINVIQGVSRFHEKIEDGDRVYCALPLFHSLPQNLCVWSTTLTGSTAIIVEHITRKSLLKGLEYKPKMIVAVPSLYGLFCMMKTAPFDSVKYFVSGGDALSDKIRALFGLLYRRKICNGYGLTETSPFISIDINDHNKTTSNVGKPLYGVSCKITDENGIKKYQGEVGILWLKGKNIMKGYYKNKEATQEVIKDGWFYTGDLAYINEREEIIIAGRHKDLIISKGINIYPQEIENVLSTHNSVIQSAVVGDEDKNGNEYPVAFVSTRSDQKEELSETLIKLCKRNLASYKIPRKIIVRKDLPLTSTGKVDKKELVKELKKT